MEYLDVFGEIVIVVGEIVIFWLYVYLVIFWFLLVGYQIDVKLVVGDGVDSGGYLGDNCWWQCQGGGGGVDLDF